MQKTEAPKIMMFEVESSNIKAIGYNEAALTLRIKFKSSETHYDYRGVPPELYSELMKSDSMGRFFFQKIKGRFDHGD